MLRDPLTGVYSRSTLSQRLQEEIDRSQRYELPMSIIFLDLDHYKSVNDAFGHLRGDQALVSFADRLRQTIRKADLIYRYGGDEFLLVLPNTSKEQANILGKRLLDAIRAAPLEGQPPIYLTLSIGIASFPEDGQRAEDLFAKADQRHYAAKRRGRNCLVNEDPIQEPLLVDMDARLVERDEAFHVLQRFLIRMNDSRRGFFSILGAEGSGRRRMLGEVGKIARLQGYEVIPLHGSPALKNRAYGDLGVIYKNWETLPSPSEGSQVFLNALASLVVEKGRSGILLSVDHLHEVDWMTLELIHQLLMDSSLTIRVALAYTAPSDQSLHYQLPIPEVMENVELSPLSKQGVKLMLRHILKWEAPEELIEWLYLQTSGLPGFIMRAILELIQQGILERYEKGWVITRSYHSFLLRERLNLQSMTPPNNLPNLPTAFIGRAQEIQTAKDILAGNHLLTITGPGGIGKTRLAIQVAAEVLNLFPQGVFWVPLASVASDIASAISNTLHFSSSFKGDAENQLSLYLRNKRCLFILDNFEHLVQGAPLISRLMDVAPQVKFIATSRQRLALQGESLLELSGFDYPTQDTRQSITSYPAVQLFIQSARRVTPEFVLSADNQDAIVQICQQVEGSPLAIELAASWVRLLTCQEIVAEMRSNQDFLATELQDVPDRHRSLRAVFNHSWDLLKPEEQHALAGLSVFHGSFSRAAAASVASASITTLIALLDKSLLYKVGDGRYILHQVLAGFGREKLAASPARQREMLVAHCRYFSEFLANLAEQLNDFRQVQAMDSLDLEFENARSAWEYASANLVTIAIDRSLHSLYYYFNLRGQFREGNQLFQATEAAFSPLNDPANRKLTARLKVRRGIFETHLSEYSLAFELFDQSMAIFQELGDRQEQAFTLLSYGAALAQIGSYELARNLLKQSLALHIEIDNACGIAQTLNELGANEYQYGDYPLAEQFHLESLRIFRELNDPWGMARTLSDLGNVESELGDYQKARQSYHESMMLSEKIGSKSDLAATLNNLGDIARASGEYAEAQQYLTRSAQLYSELGDRYGMAIALLNLGDTALRLSQFTQASECLRASLTLSQDTNDFHGVAYARIGLANLAIAVQDWAKAAALLDQAMLFAAEAQAIPLLMQSLLAVSALFAQLGELSWAQEITQFILNHPVTLKADRDEANKLNTLIATRLEISSDQTLPPTRLVDESANAISLIHRIRSQAVFSNLISQETFSEHV